MTRDGRENTWCDKWGKTWCATNGRETMGAVRETHRDRRELGPTGAVLGWAQSESGHMWEEWGS